MCGVEREAKECPEMLAKTSTKPLPVIFEAKDPSHCAAHARRTCLSAPCLAQLVVLYTQYPCTNRVVVGYSRP